MGKELEIVLNALEIQFTRGGVTIIGFPSGVYKLPYEKITYAYVRVFDRVAGMYREPELAEVSKEMDGELILHDSDCHKYRIRTEQLGRTAGSLLIDLAMRAPYIVLGGQDWFDEDDEREFMEIEDMVHLRRQC